VMIHFGVLGCEKWNALHAAPVLASYPCVARARILSGESGTCIHRQNESASEGKMASQRSHFSAAVPQFARAWGGEGHTWQDRVRHRCLPTPRPCFVAHVSLGLKPQRAGRG
jgi:hypothetical protein